MYHDFLSYETIWIGIRDGCLLEVILSLTNLKLHRTYFNPFFFILNDYYYYQSELIIELKWDYLSAANNQEGLILTYLILKAVLFPL